MIQSVERTLDIMTCISNNKGEPVTVSQISQQTGINKSTCCHLIETLVERGFLNQVSRSAGYVLGIYAYNLTRYNSYHRDLIFNAMPVLRWAKNKTQCTSVLTKLIDGEKFVLCYSEYTNNSLKERGDLYKGALYDTATGRSMLSTLKPKELKQVVDKVGLPTQDEWPGVDSFAKLEEELDKISKQKFVKVVGTYNGNYRCQLGKYFLSSQLERFAIGIEIITEKQPDEARMIYIERVLLTSVKEVKRRMNFDNV